MEKLGQNNIYSQYLGNKAILRTYKGTDLINEYVPLYTPPVDWSDIRTDCPENSIALYAAHSADYSSYDNLGFTATMSATDLTTVGSPTIVDGVASEFSSSNYLKTSLSLSSDNEKIRIKIRFKTPETFVSGNTNILTFGNSLTTNNCIRIYTGSSYSRISSFGNDINTGSPNLQTNTFYVVDVLIDGNKQYSYLYDDNNTKLAESANTTKTANFNNIGFFGGRFYSPIQEIDFNNTSIEVNDVYYLLPYGSSNGYNVFIDGTQYGSTYASGAQCSITWSTSGITTGDDITTPSTLKAHKIWIEPATEGNNIADFTGARVVSGSGYEDQGILWAHFNIDTSIFFCMGVGNGYRNRLIKAITAKNNLLNVRNLEQSCHYCENLIYVPLLVGPNTTISSSFSSFYYCSSLQKLNFKNIKVRSLGNTFFACPSLLKLPKIDFSGAVFANRFVVNATSLKDTIIDMSSATGLRIVGIYGDSTHRINGLKGLRVSNEAPFDYAISPQIDVSYTGLDRSALVQLFNDLSYNVGYEVVGSPTINNGVVSGFSGSSYVQSSTTFPGSTATSLEFATKFNISSFASTSTIASSTYSIILFHLAVRDSKFRLYPGREDIYKVGDFVLSENVDYYIKLFWNSANGWKLQYSTDGINYTTDFENYNPSDSAPKDNYIVLGRNYVNGGQEGLLGSIDLNNTYIKINDVYWFRGQPAMTKTLSCVGCTGNQLRIVGSPTIVDGVVSGFSNVPNRSDVTTLDSLPSSSSLLIQVKFNTGTLKTDANQFILSTLSQTNRNICWGVAGQSKKIRIYLSSNGTTWDIANSVNGTHILADNTDYIARLTFDGSKYVVSLLIDGQWVDDITITSSLALSKQILRFGNNETGSSYWPGSIDLNETYIKVNGETWFDINNCLLPEDRAIATNKNWTLTLS